MFRLEEPGDRGVYQISVVRIGLQQTSNDMGEPDPFAFRIARKEAVFLDFRPSRTKESSRPRQIVGIVKG